MIAPSPEVISVLDRIVAMTDPRIQPLLLELMAESHVATKLDAAKVVREVATNVAKSLTTEQSCVVTIAYEMLAKHFEDSATMERKEFRRLMAETQR